MNFTAYIERQKSLIRKRHEGEEFLMHGGEVIPMDDSEKILKELAELEGFNSHECLRAV
ncbi:MAG: hypothetical protein J1G07_00825 [Clostridiales bacterium]|nr:hypothetical protein [Clostridiales bacterium]